MSMSERDGTIWMDGRLVDWRDAKIHVLTHTLHYGCGAFEGVRAYNTANGTAIFRLREHTERLFNSAKILRMKLPFTMDQVMAAQCSACHAAGVAGAPKFGDHAAWEPRIKAGYESLLNSALKGKGYVVIKMGMILKILTRQHVRSDDG